MYFSTLKPKQNSRHFADIFMGIFLKEIVVYWLKFVPKGPINNNPTLVQIMVWRQTNDKLSEPMLAQSDVAYLPLSASISW